MKEDPDGLRKIESYGVNHAAIQGTDILMLKIILLALFQVQKTGR